MENPDKWLENPDKCFENPDKCFENPDKCLGNPDIFSPNKNSPEKFTNEPPIRQEFTKNARIVTERKEDFSLIALERAIPLIILMLEALLRRLPGGHPKRKDIEESLRTQKAGYNGEKSVDYYLNFLDQEKFMIFKGLRLNNNGFFFQIDTLLITPFFALILEIKNWGGEIHFEKNFCQVFQEKDGKTATYTNPVSQAKLQTRNLREWLKNHNFPDIPIEFLVVMSNNTSKLKADPGYYEVFKKVTLAIRLIEKVSEIEKSHKQMVLESKAMKKVMKVILQQHMPHRPDILKNFTISTTEILSGIICPKCLSFTMKFHYRKSYCDRCGEISQTAHLEAIQDYFLLISPYLTNSELKRFLNLPKPDQAYNLLTSLNFPFTGTKRGRVYYQPPNWQPDMLLPQRKD
ncbi:nuclease-related domain-containing protein [Neobacillus piezotolerans]|uniref:nuclease-related domain-containing protein n=1 Tax=Neobacillus piezotolerans TaxID=2259171 RepID=UPI001CA3D15F|nr:nuclease-related domain-containing protein [Neobacillus piezotolerans]